MSLVPTPDRVQLPQGFQAAGVHCGLKRDGALDLGLLLADEAVPAAGLFTRNRLVGAHVPVCRKHLRDSGGRVRAVLVNAKNANCATGQKGIADALTCCAELARRLSCPVEQVLMISTGVIGAMLPTARIVEHLDDLLGSVGPDRGRDFATAIMTTDTYPKALQIDSEGTAVAGFAKGSGMIHPDMATMLAFLVTDGGFEAPETGQSALRRIADRSMHRVTVDGDTSPNDTMLLLHAGRSQAGPAELERALTAVGRDLARHIAADGEGASRLVTVEVQGARSESEAAHVGRVIATSPLVKTAIAGRDPNWGRILSAAGRAGIDFDAARARVWIGEFEMYREGLPNVADEPAASRYLEREPQVCIGVDLGIGQSAAEVWTCDLTADYVRINADYRT